jgi:serine/threonine-protein kinase
MARVDLAEDQRLRRRVAVKRLDEELARFSEYRAGFLAEAQIGRQLDHPNVLPVHEVGVTADGVPYFTMSAVPGITFAEWLRDPHRRVGSLARLLEGIAILLEICDAVAYAHGRGVIHRDVKPDNVIVSEHGHVYLIDWGLARLFGDHRLETDPPCRDYDGAVGTPGYMSPEQARGNPLEMDQRSDVFGLGAVFYEILSGRTPYGEAKNSATLLLRAWNGDVVPIEQVMHGIVLPPRMLGIARKAIAVDPDARYQSVPELQADLREVLGRVDDLPDPEDLVRQAEAARNEPSPRRHDTDEDYLTDPSASSPRRYFGITGPVPVAPEISRS